MPEDTIVEDSVIIKEVEVEPSQSFIDLVVARVKEFLNPAAEPIIEVGDKPFIVFRQKNGSLRFFAWGTNNFRDKHKEIIPEFAHEEYVEWVEKTSNYPELWLWHTPGTQFGKADWVDVSDGFLALSGVINKEYEAVAERLATSDEPLGMSHGMWALVTKSGEIILYRSYEFSVLPEDSAASVAGGTGFVLLTKEGEEMAFNEKRKDWLKKMGGFDDTQIATFEKQSENMRETLKSQGFEWKEADTTEADGTVKEMVAVEDLQPLVVDVQQLKDAVVAISKGMEAIAKSQDDKLSELISARIGDMAKGYRASEDEGTIMNKNQEKNPANDTGWWGEVMVNVQKSAGVTTGV